MAGEKHSKNLKHMKETPQKNFVVIYDDKNNTA